MNQNLFMPIDWQQENAEEEFNRRQQMNSQVDFMNQLSQQNAGNKYVQNALLEKYMGMAFPQQEDPMQKLEMGLGFMQSDIPALQQAGQDILGSNPLTSQYFEGVDMSNMGQQPDPFKDFLGNIDRYDINERQGLFDSFIQGAQDPIQATEYQKLKDYYTGEATFKDALAARDMAKSGQISIEPMEGLSEAQQKNKLYQLRNRQEYMPYLEQYGINL